MPEYYAVAGHIYFGIPGEHLIHAQWIATCRLRKDEPLVRYGSPAIRIASALNAQTMENIRESPVNRVCHLHRDSPNECDDPALCWQAPCGTEQFQRGDGPLFASLGEYQAHRKDGDRKEVTQN